MKPETEGGRKGGREGGEGRMERRKASKFIQLVKIEKERGS